MNEHNSLKEYVTNENKLIELNMLIHTVYTLNKMFLFSTIGLYS